MLARMTLTLGGLLFLCASLFADPTYNKALQNFRESERTEESLAATIRVRQITTGENDQIARICVLRDLADLEAAEDHWRDALGYSRTAFEITRRLEDANLILIDGLRAAHFAFLAGERGIAAILARELATIAEQLERPAELEDAWMILAKVHQVSGDRDRANTYFDQILALPSRDPFPVLEQKAWGYHGLKHNGFLQEIWSRALNFAKNESNIDRQITALQKLAELAVERDDRSSAQTHLDQIARLLPDHPATQSSSLWLAVAKLQISDDRIDEAMTSIRHGIEQATTDNDADMRIVLLAELAKLQAHTDPASAYATLEAAYTERIAIGRNQQFIPETAIAITQTREELEALSELAAVRNALRDAELSRTQSRNRQIAATAIALTLLATVLALAFLLKRRAAQAATLRAENAQLEALRYQLNPHFLFNTLANLNGLILTAPDRARHTVRRLSDFCRLALARQESPLLTIKAEAARLRAYLDVALAAEEDDLKINFTVDPAAEAHSIPPLLIQPLLENALKYAESNESDQRIVTATIAAPSPTTLSIVISNTGPWGQPASTRPSTGVGLKNLHERLAHYYPNRHHLTFTKTPTQVTATLTIHQA